MNEDSEQYQFVIKNTNTSFLERPTASLFENSNASFSKNLTANLFENSNISYCSSKASLLKNPSDDLFCSIILKFSKTIFVLFDELLLYDEQKVNL